MTRKRRPQCSIKVGGLGRRTAAAVLIVDEGGTGLPEEMPLVVPVDRAAMADPLGGWSRVSDEEVDVVLVENDMAATA